MGTIARSFKSDKGSEKTRVPKAAKRRHRQALVTFASVIGVLLFVLSSMQVSSAQIPREVRYTRAYDLGNAGHLDDLGLIEGKRHLVIQQYPEIRIIEVSATGFALRATITNPLSGDWGQMLTVVSDVNGDGVNDIATYGRDNNITGNWTFYVLSGNHLPGSIVDGNSAAIYTIPFGQLLPRYASAKPASNEILLTEFPATARRRDAVTGSILHTVTGPKIANGGIWVGDFDGDSIADYLTGGAPWPDVSALHIISGEDRIDGSASSRAVGTFFDPETPGLGYAEDNNNIAAAIGDVNGDGIGEIAVGSRLYRLDYSTNWGRVVVFDGATESVLYRIEPDQTHTNGVYFGNNILATGDINGDGIGDFIVSARGYSRTPGGFGDGAIIGFSGVNGAEVFRYYGATQETMGDYEMSRIGDLNADGIDDLGVAGYNASIWLSTFQTDQDGDGFRQPDDCDDLDPAIHPGASEVCDGLDNDCSGGLDDNLQPQPTSCGVGACAATGQTICVKGVLRDTCSPGQSSTETCNNVDDDCDGQADELLGFLDCGTGACENFVRSCVAGVPQVCVAGSPLVEVCNGIDDNCDSATDEDLGSTTCGVGTCTVTVNNCVDGLPQTCVPGAPTAEMCNGLDDDCDSAADEDLGSTTCGVGTCTVTVNNCVDGLPQTCVPGAPTAEMCNGLDDDCDSIIDDALGPGTVGVSLDPDRLWPPNHRMVDIHATVTLSGGCPSACLTPPVVVLTSATSDEPDDANGVGDGQTVNDIQDAAVGSADFEFKLRAERDSSGQGRLYEVTYTVTDCSGEAAVGDGGVLVPHDEGGHSEPLIMDVVSQRSGGQAGFLLSWESVRGPASYNILRGRLSQVRSVGSFTVIEGAECLERGITVISFSGQSLEEVPPPGEAFFYLAEYFDGRYSGYGTATGMGEVVITSGDSCH